MYLRLDRRADRSIAQIDTPFLHIQVLCIITCNFTQDAFKLLTGQGIAMDEDMRKSFEGSDRSNLAASIEAMKTRRASQLMTKALRQFNPKLAKALIDDRDEVAIRLLLLAPGSL